MALEPVVAAPAELGGGVGWGGGAGAPRSAGVQPVDRVGRADNEAVLRFAAAAGQ